MNILGATAISFAILLFAGMLTIKAKDEIQISKILSFLAGSFFILGLSVFVQFNDRTQEDFSVRTKEKPTVEYEISIKNNIPDTTFYYNFKTSDVIVGDH